MTTEQFSCPYCNALIPRPASIGPVTCPRCGEAYRWQDRLAAACQRSGGSRNTPAGVTFRRANALAVAACWPQCGVGRDQPGAQSCFAGQRNRAARLSVHGDPFGNGPGGVALAVVSPQTADRT